jgi:hypothetical protein
MDSAGSSLVCHLKINSVVGMSGEIDEEGSKQGVFETLFHCIDCSQRVLKRVQLLASVSDEETQSKS